MTGSEQELWSELRRAEARGARVVLVGGDGSLHAAANAPLRRLPELALVPAGRANNIARALGIPVDRAGALSVAAGRPARPLDALRVVTPDRLIYALEAVSAGFQAQARAGYDADNSSDLRQGLRAFARALVRYRPYAAVVRLTGGELRTPAAAQLFFSNLPYFGFGFEVDPGADPGDGRFEAIAIEARSRRRLLWLLAAARRGRHIGRRGVRRLTRALRPRGRAAAAGGRLGAARDHDRDGHGGARAPAGGGAMSTRVLFVFSLAAVGAGAGRALTTTYLPVLLERIDDAPTLIGAVMAVNAIAGFAIPIAIGVWSDRRGRRLPVHRRRRGRDRGRARRDRARQRHLLPRPRGRRGARLHRPERAHHGAPRDRGRRRRGRPPPRRHERAGGRRADRSGRRGRHRRRPDRARPGGGLRAGRRWWSGWRRCRRSPSAAGSRSASAARRPLAGRSGRSSARRCGASGAREVLLAQTLWVFAYASLPAFFVLYAEDSLGLGRRRRRALLPLGFGALTALGMLARRTGASRARAPAAARRRGHARAPACWPPPRPTGIRAAAPAFAVAALGAGLVTALGFPYFARFVPDGRGRALQRPVLRRARGRRRRRAAAGRARRRGERRLRRGAVARRRRARRARPAHARRAPPARRTRRPAALPRPSTVAAVVPVFASGRAAEVARAALRHVDRARARRRRRAAGDRPLARAGRRGRARAPAAPGQRTAARAAR